MLLRGLLTSSTRFLKALLSMLPLAVILTASSTGGDPITALLTRDWAAFGGWSLFLGLSLLIVVGSFREWWVPGGRYRRLETSSQAQSETLALTVNLLEKQTTANEITKHFFEETAPKRRGEDA